MNHQTDYFYAVKHMDEDVRSKSRSGGVFTALSDFVLGNGGVVYGVVLNENFLAEHRRATTKEERDLFRGSKYIQSMTGKVYQQVKDDLKQGKMVLFSGTPCQIDALKIYTEVEQISTKDLLAVDVLCHGVPSPKVWVDFLKYKQPNGEVIEAVDFRDKEKCGWRAHKESVVINGQKQISDIFTKLFYSHYILRPSCFECYYKKRERVSDITIGDYWRIENIAKDFDDDKGVSLVIVNTEKGRRLFERIKGDLKYMKLPAELSMQAALKENYSAPLDRDRFWKDYGEMSFECLIKKYLK